MKKIYSILLALPLMVAATLVSCTDDNNEIFEQQKTEPKKVTFKAAMPQTRVTYLPNGNTKIKCDWDAQDVGRTVVFTGPTTETTTTNDDGDIIYVHTHKTYDFEVNEINTSGDKSTATLTYTGICKTIVTEFYPNDTKHTTITEGTSEFPDPFTGTASFLVSDEEQVQAINPTYNTANQTIEDDDKATAHLGNGDEFVATLNNLSSSPEPTDVIMFQHAESAIFRVTFKSPGTFGEGSKLYINANGTDNLGVVTLNFALSQDEVCTAYVRCTTVTPINEASLVVDPIDHLTFVLQHPGTDSKNAHVCRKFFSNFTNIATVGTPINPDNPNADVDHGTNGLVSGKFYYVNITEYTTTNTEIDNNTREEKKWFEQETAAANVIGYAPLSNKLVAIPLDANHKYTTNANDVAYYLYVGHDVLKKKSGNIQSETDPILYYYWGDVVGHTVHDVFDEDYLSWGWYYYNNQTLLDLNPDDAPDFQFSVDDTKARSFYVEDSWGQSIKENYIFPETKTIGKYSYKYWTLRPYVDAATYNLKGGWRMMDFFEAQAFLKATTFSSTGLQTNSTDGNGNTIYNKHSNSFTYTYNDGTPITLPSTGRIEGTTIDFSNNDALVIFFSWLRLSTPAHNVQEDLHCAMIFKSVTADQYNPEPLDDENPYYFQQFEDNVFEGIPVLPAIVVDANTGKPDR